MRILLSQCLLFYDVFMICFFIYVFHYLVYIKLLHGTVVCFISQRAFRFQSQYCVIIIVQLSGSLNREWGMF